MKIVYVIELLLTIIMTFVVIALELICAGMSGLLYLCAIPFSMGVQFLTKIGNKLSHHIKEIDAYLSRKKQAS